MSTTIRSFTSPDSPENQVGKMVVYALIIINKAGGLIYQRDFAEGLNKLTVNDYLVLAGTFHGIHAITTRLHPLSSSSSPSPSASAPDERPPPPSGIEVLETENFRLQCFQTLTGTKFLLFTEPQQPNTDRVLQEIYRLYGDYVMKNPFYQLEMPVSFNREPLGKVVPAERALRICSGWDAWADAKPSEGKSQAESSSSAIQLLDAAQQAQLRKDHVEVRRSHPQVYLIVQ
ncbi:uncharacterized protein L3040_004580 [Drepanopeziza brunnea f. sp. 'multigermtubi']|uniref:uncharacterized protein n=1 Tax=Drepanopeziza brunnea f. sp. 'multigermtubi' TaxID=698441 RepID=UPI0023962B72|nr:hypothetical protein L3040_004580 [Drepanopeziza brunnea f. sp. 'multigermtubi']